MAAILKPKNPKKDTITISAGPRMKAALLLAIVADVAQIAVLPLFIEGYASPADDLLDLHQMKRGVRRCRSERQRRQDRREDQEPTRHGCGLLGSG